MVLTAFRIGTRMVPGPSHLDQFVQTAQRLCSLPGVAVKVLELTANPKVDTRALKECIENDPALTSKILRVVNSSLFGLSREVSDLNQALALLGTKPLKLLVLGFSLPPSLFTGVTPQVLGHYWRRTLTKAVAARELAEQLWNQPGDDAFIAGLLDDLGMLVLIQELGTPYIQFVEEVRRQGQDLGAAELRALGFRHMTLSARLLEHWGLPHTLVDAVAWSSEEIVSADLSWGEGALARIVHLAEILTRLLLDGRPGALGELLERGRDYCNLSERQVEDLVSVLEEKVSQLADVLLLDLPCGMNYQEVLLQSQAQLAEVATAAAGELLRHHTDVPPADPWAALAGNIAEVSQAAAQPQAKPVSPPQAAGRAVAFRGPHSAVGSVSGGGVRRKSSSTLVASSELLEELAVAAAWCRNAHCPLSLLLIALRVRDQASGATAAEGTTWLRPLLEPLSQAQMDAGAQCVPLEPDGFALILPNCDRRRVVEVGNRILDSFRPAGHMAVLKPEHIVSLDVGAATVAMPPKNFRPEDLFDGADRCLFGSRASGGGVLKSIEIY